MHCRIHYAKPFPMPIFAPLPTTRVLVGKPFDCIGIEMAGPIHLNSGEVYYLLITCLKIRAIHLEVVPTLFTKDFMLAFKKFVARRGTPSYILSDNATYFILARKQLTLKSKTSTTIIWQTITPRASHEGGIYERLNRTIKDSLKKTIRRRKLLYQEFEVLLISIEGVLNDRSLLPMTDDSMF